MRFHVSPEDKKAVRFSVRGPLDYNFYFDWSTGSAVYAHLLAEDFNRRLDAAVREARETAYNNGWKDAKAKTKKCTAFGSYLVVV